MEIEQELWIGFKTMPAEELDVEVVADATHEPNVNKPGTMQYVLHLKAKADGSLYKHGLSPTSLAVLTRAWGKETTKWIGKKLKLKKGKIRGNDAMIVEPVSK